MITFNTTIVDSTKPTVLIVEDNESIREAICYHLEDQFNIIPAATANDAIRQIASTCEINLLITDFDLCEKLDGLDIARAMYAKNLRSTPIILVTGSCLTIPRIQELFLIPNTWLLMKPFEIRCLDQIIKSVLDNINVNGKF